MFIKLSRIVTLMKKAYKTGGLRVANREAFYSLEGTGWAIQIYRDHTPKELLGEIVKLTGRLPEHDEQFLAKEEGNQEEILYRDGDYLDVYRNALEAEAEGNMLEMTQFYISTPGGTLYSVYQETGDDGIRMHIMQTGLASMMDKGFCERDEELQKPYRGYGNALYRRSDHMAITVSLYVPEKLEPAVDVLSNHDLIGIMEGDDAPVS